MTNILSIAQHNARIQDEAARKLIKQHMVACLTSLAEAITVAQRYGIYDIPCLEMTTQALQTYHEQYESIKQRGN